MSFEAGDIFQARECIAIGGSPIASDTLMAGTTDNVQEKLNHPCLFVANFEYADINDIAGCVKF